SRAESLGKPRSFRASGHLRNARLSPLPARHAYALPPRSLVPVAVDHRPEEQRECLPASTHDLDLIHRDAPALDRSGRVKSRRVTNPQSRFLEFEAEIARAISRNR